MTGTEKLMQEIKAEVEKTAQPPEKTTRFLCCSECKAATTFDISTQPPATCKFCGKEVRRWGIGMSYSEAKQKAEGNAPQAAPIEQPKPVAPVAPAPATQENVTVAQPVAPAEPVAVTQQPVAAQPEQKKRRATKQPVAQPADMSSPVAAPTPPAPPEPTTGQVASENFQATMQTLDLREVRRKAIEKLASTHNLDNHMFRPVGTAKVYCLGFTTWERTAEGGSVPSYTFKELTDTAESFRTLMNEARREHGGRVAVDVAMLTEIEPAELRACLYQCQLVASIFGERGPIAVAPGAKVEVGARLSNSGGLVFRITKVL